MLLVPLSIASSLTSPSPNNDVGAPPLLSNAMAAKESAIDRRTPSKIRSWGLLRPPEEKIVSVLSSGWMAAIYQGSSPDQNRAWDSTDRFRRAEDNRIDVGKRGVPVVLNR